MVITYLWDNLLPLMIGLLGFVPFKSRVSSVNAFKGLLIEFLFVNLLLFCSYWCISGLLFLPEATLGGFI